MIRPFFLTLGTSLTINCFTLAQVAERQVVNQSIEWFSVASTAKIHKKVNVLTEGVFRFAGAFEPMQFQVRSGVEVVLSKKWSVVPLGYVYTWNPLYGKQPNTFVNNEHRIWEQVQYKHHVNRAHISHRARLEQRHVQVHTNNNGDIVNHGYDLYTNRFRYRFMMTMPLNRAQMETGTLYMNLYNETFISWGKKVTYHEPDQNRIFAGLGYNISKSFSILGGPLYQMLIKSGGTKQENNVGVQIQVTYNVDFTK